MAGWPVTRVTLLDRLRDPGDRQAWAEFVGLYGPLLFHFARRRLPQDEDAANVTQVVLGAVMAGKYRRPGGRFQKWLVTVLLNAVRDFHAARARRGEVCGGPAVAQRLLEEPDRGAEEEWDRERQRHLFRVAAGRVQARANPLHWDAFVRTALHGQPARVVARALGLSVANVYAVKSRLLKEIRDEVRRFGED